MAASGIDYQTIFADIAQELTQTANEGEIAAYIPELGAVDAQKLGMHLITVQGQHYGFGDELQKFSIQSIAKVFALVMAFELEGEQLWQRVGIEPSGSPFNSLVQLEYEQGIPRNPFINAGALVVCDVLVSHFADATEALLAFVRELTGVDSINYSHKVADSERQTSYRNRAMINFMKSYGNINNDIEQVLDVYFCLCALEMSCAELAQAFLFLANGGVNPLNNQRVLNTSKTKRVNALMQLCGFYDEAGEFAFKVGLPGKSGVGGGIIAVHPRRYSIAVWSPKLNRKGNSYRGMKILEALTSKSRLSIF